MATKNKKEMQNVFDDSVATKLDWIVDTQLPEGVQLSQNKYIDPAELKINPLNQELFAKESDEYFKSLTLDIKQRGILVPLIAKQDNVLLAGENRLAIARQLKLKKVPVQIILSQLSDQEEVETLAKDNLFRRHISSQQRFKIYMKLYPDFEGSLNQEKRGRSKTPKLTAEIIARDTNQKVESVRKQLQRYKKKAPKASTTKDKVITTPLKANVGSQIQTHLQALTKLLKLADTATIEKAVQQLNQLQKKYEQSRSNDTKK